MHDKMALFNMRPPELLCIDSVGLYIQSFDQQKHSFSNQTLRLMFQAYTLAPWIDCFGHWTRLRRAALNNIENFVSHMNSEAHHYTLKIIYLCKDGSADCWIWLLPDEDISLPEIVFKNVTSRNTISFLVSFVLRFGH